MRLKNLFLAFLFCLLSLSAFAGDERILSFHSGIVIHPDSTMTVTETIKVRSTGDEIKRGIYRDFPTRYRDSLGNNYNVQFNVISVLKDGEPESYHFGDLSNGCRVYMGKKDVYLDPGEYTYTLVYKTSRQLGFFKDFDELYWNVTGNGWVFPIDSASADIELPPGAAEKVINLEAYTGSSGSKGSDYLSSTMEPGKVSFVTTKPLNSYEGLTIVVSWPKGFVREPDAKEKLNYFLADNASVLAGLAGLILILLYYLLVWSKVGRDPARGVIIPLYEPPKGMSPAAVRFIMKMGFDHKTFAAAVVSMAQKGYLAISEEKGVYTISRTDKTGMALSADEHAVARDLVDPYKKVVLENGNHAVIGGALASLGKNLKNSYEKNYFITNVFYFIPGVIISIFAMGVAILLINSERLPIALFMSAWLSIWTIGVAALLNNVAVAWKAFFYGGKKLGEFVQAVFISLFALPFIAGEIFGIGMFTYAASFTLALVLLVGAGINVLFYHLLKAPTLLGRRVMDQIEGFKMYLSVAEQDRMNFFNQPGRTPELFEKYLPYAIALDVENAWAEQFNSVFKQAGQEEQTYHPAWYAGTSSWMGASAFASTLGSSFSGAISSSSTAPGSSSGGGGGGGSGGGGGGGGGGGW